MKLADAIVSCLRDLDLKYLFGVSGANIEHIHDSVYRLGQGRLITIMTKTEQGAAFMADGRARVHQTLGLCCATSGGGMMNLATGIAESLAHNVPVLALVGQTPMALEKRGGFQDSSGGSMRVDGLKMFQAIAKFAAKIESADSFWALFEEAIRAPFRGPQGPSVLLIPRDLMELEVGEVPPRFPKSITELQMAAYESQVIEQDLLDKLWSQLQQARKPVLILGSDVLRHQAENLATQFAKATGVNVVSTLSSLSTFPNEDDQYLGMIGIAGHPSAHQYVKTETDFVLAVGTQLRIMSRGTLTPTLKEKTLWIANEHLGELDESLDATGILRCTPKAFFEALLKRHQNQPLNFSTYAAPYRRLYFKPQSVQYYEWQPPSHTNGFTQSQALEVLEAFLPQFKTILLDAGNCATAAAHYLDFPNNSTVHIALGMGGMGYAVSAAIGAQLGQTTKQRTLALCGDGAFLMTGFEVHTAVELQLPILWILFNNNMHGMCITRQHRFFDGRFEGNTYSTIDIKRITQGLGNDSQLWCECANSAIELESHLSSYFNLHAHKPGVIELKIRQEELPPVETFLNAQAEVCSTWQSLGLTPERLRQSIY